MEQQTFTGCLPDTRPIEEKQKDWYKITTSGGLVFEEKSFEDIKTFPVRDQDGSGSCVAQTLALIMGIENYLEEGKFIEFSAKDIYTRRSNKDSMGMIGVEALDIARKYGATLEVLIPSQNMGESEINNILRNTSDEQIGKIFTIKDFYQLPFSLESIASIMESGRKNGVAKPIMGWFMFPRKEWTAIPKLSNSEFDIVHHSVTLIDYGIMNGERGLFIQDSWGLHSTTVNGLRFISEDYLKRMTFCAYINDKENDWQNEKKWYNFNRILRKGMKGEDVKELQKLLEVSVDGVFGIKTEVAVKLFQSKNGLLEDGVVGPQTLSKLIA